MNKRLLEGYFIITSNNHIFEIKGDIHPKERLIAYLRYVPDKNGNRVNSDGQTFRKIYELKERENYLKKYLPCYLQFDQVNGRILQSVPIEDVMLILNPVDTLNQFRDMGSHGNKLQKISLKLAECLVKESKIQWSDIGITGSQLAGLSVLNSDIDLVVYGIEPANRIYSTLERKFDSISCIHRYSGDMLNQHVNFRWGRNNQNWDLLKTIESKKNLQGLFENKEFFIRLVKKYNELYYRYGDVIFQDNGSYSIYCEIVDDSDSIFTPCRYSVNCETVPELTELVSYRGRFTEHVGRGMSVKAKGRLESVQIRKTGKFNKRLVLGENSADYLIPV